MEVARLFSAGDMVWCDTGLWWHHDHISESPCTLTTVSDWGPPVTGHWSLVSSSSRVSVSLYNSQHKLTISGESVLRLIFTACLIQIVRHDHTSPSSSVLTQFFISSHPPHMIIMQEKVNTNDSAQLIKVTRKNLFANITGNCRLCIVVCSTCHKLFDYVFFVSFLFNFGQLKSLIGPALYLCHVMISLWDGLSLGPDH